MCEALKELMADELKAAENKGRDYVNILNTKLGEMGRNEDIQKAAKDPEYQKQLIREFVDKDFGK